MDLEQHCKEQLQRATALKHAVGHCMTRYSGAHNARLRILKGFLSVLIKVYLLNYAGEPNKWQVNAVDTELERIKKEYLEDFGNPLTARLSRN
jgi:hypothetical protein